MHRDNKNCFQFGFVRAKNVIFRNITTYANKLNIAKIESFAGILTISILMYIH